MDLWGLTFLWNCADFLPKYHIHLSVSTHYIMVSIFHTHTIDIRPHAISALAFLWNPFKNVTEHTTLLIVRYKGSNFTGEIFQKF